jgi:hypothetical protein
MKGDFTRITFNPEKNFSCVRMQQGRVLLDSDWNEQADIVSNRIEIEAKDIAGRCGGPIKGAGFRISANIDDLTPEESEEIYSKDLESLKSGDFIITLGRYYVDGILCENHHNLAFSAQSYKPSLEALQDEGKYHIYLDVWKRHVTSVEDPEIVETALEGPDTTTRLETVWQVKARRWWDFPNFIKDRDINNCDDATRDLLMRGKGRLSTEASTGDGDGQCSMASRGGYLGLENHLYRVEIHDGGQPYGWRGQVLYGYNNTLYAKCRIVNASVGTIGVFDDDTEEGEWKVGQFVEVFDLNSSIKGILARIEKVTPTSNAVHSTVDPKQELKLNKDLSKLVSPSSDLRIQHVASFKWSRDNGSVAFSIESFPEGESNKVKVQRLGRDKSLSLQAGDWVEILDDATEFRGQAGTLASISINGVDEADREITLSADVSSYKTENNQNNPRIRRWDRSEDTNPTDLVNPITMDLMNLEDGIGIRFSLESNEEVIVNDNLDRHVSPFRTGDYWTFYARSINGYLEKLTEARPEGIEHHYCTLAFISEAPEGGRDIYDCRKLFPPATELISLFYLGGDGQEAKPGEALKEPLRVGVSRGQWPLSDSESKRFRVRFYFPDEVSGQPQGFLSDKRDDFSSQSKELILPIQTEGTDQPAGTAQCYWKPSSNASGRQVVEARLVDAVDISMNYHLPIRFIANLSLASDISYSLRGCKALPETENVQEALDQIHHLASLYYQGGNCQEAIWDPAKTELAIKLSIPLSVKVANDCGPVSKASVTFKASNGLLLGDPNSVTSSVTTPKEIIQANTEVDGLVSCYWLLKPDPRFPYQEVVATLNSAGGYPVDVLTSVVRFTAKLNAIDAGQVSFSPREDCKTLADTRTVQEAINRLCVDPGIHITKIQFMGDDDKTFVDLDIDSAIRADRLTQGIYIICDTRSKIAPDSVTANRLSPWKSNCLVILDLPYPPNYEGEGNYFGTMPVILNGNAEVLKDDPNIIRWMPSDDFAGVFLNGSYPQPRILQAHLVLKGNSIWSSDDPNIYLDGETLVGRKSGTIVGMPRRTLQLPSGDGKRGGDFEMHFLVTPMILTVIFEPPSVKSGNSTRLTISMGILAPANGAVISLTSNNPNIVQVPQTVTIPANTKSSVPIDIKTANVTSPTNVAITVTYKGGKAQGQGILTITPPT